MNIGLVIGKFHHSEADAMREEAEETALEYRLNIVSAAWIPGAMEAPLMAKRLIQSDSVDGLVVLGIIERGETKHGIVMAQAVITALIGLQLEYMKPIGVGILGPDIFPSQIPARVRPYARSAIKAVHHMLSIRLS
jgi:6,7-dimethyl-8-ribityllumazine synthase